MSSTHRKKAAQRLADTLHIPYQTARKAIDEALGYAYPAGIPEARPPRPQQPTSPAAPEADTSTGRDLRWDRFTPNQMMPAPTDYSKYAWSQFPLGRGLDGEEIVLDISSLPHTLVAGRTGSGKTVVERLLLHRALASDNWRVLAIDPKRVELASYRKHPRMLKIATELTDSVALLEQAEQEMYTRYRRMQEAGVNHFMHMLDSTPAILLVVDETFALLAPENVKSQEGKQRDEQHARATTLLGSLLRLGRAAGIHVLLSSQRPDAKVLNGEMKSNIDVRIACGTMDLMPSLIVMDSDDACRTPAGPGNCAMRIGGEVVAFRAYYAEPPSPSAV